MKPALPRLSALAAALACSLPLAALAAPSPAVEEDKVFSPMLGFAFTAGGTGVYHVTIVNQDTGTVMDTSEIKAGAQDFVYAGAEFRPRGTPIAIQGILGYHWDERSALNGEINFSRTVFELTGLYKVLPWLRVGGGLRYDMRVRLNGKEQGSQPETTWEMGNALGGVVKAEWLVTPDTGIEMRWHKINYKIKTVGGQDVSGQPDTTIDGRGFGVGLNLHF